ncbi:MAG: tsaE [Firmicutes bacterium]|nr:tsaE [Bacillota bacterium]
MLELITNQPEDTLRFGETMAAKLQAGDVICLSGDLGAGKTLLTQGIAAGMGTECSVTSPTFTIMQVYDDGRVPIYHFDLYRLDIRDELDNIGFEEYIGRDGVAIIEWADKFPAAMPKEYLWLEITIGKDSTERIIRITPAGERFIELCEELRVIADSCVRHSDVGL